MGRHQAKRHRVLCCGKENNFPGTLICFIYLVSKLFFPRGLVLGGCSRKFSASRSR
jgi:hypothetical protein